MNRVLSDRMTQHIITGLIFIGIALIYKFFIKKKPAPKKVFTAHLTLGEQIKDVMNKMAKCETLLDIYEVRGKVNRLQRIYDYEPEVVEKCDMWLDQLSTMENNMVFRMSKLPMQN